MPNMNTPPIKWTSQQLIMATTMTTGGPTLNSTSSVMQPHARDIVSNSAKTRTSPLTSSFNCISLCVVNFAGVDRDDHICLPDGDDQVGVTSNGHHYPAADNINDRDGDGRSVQPSAGLSRNVFPLRGYTLCLFGPTSCAKASDGFFLYSRACSESISLFLCGHCGRALRNMGSCGLTHLPSLFLLALRRNGLRRIFYNMSGSKVTEP